MASRSPNRGASSRRSAPDSSTTSSAFVLVIRRVDDAQRGHAWSWELLRGEEIVERDTEGQLANALLLALASAAVRGLSATDPDTIFSLFSLSNREGRARIPLYTPTDVRAVPPGALTFEDLLARARRRETEEL